MGKSRREEFKRLAEPIPFSDEIIFEINNFEERMNQYLEGKVGDDSFQRFRLQHGVYGQRQDGVHMIRIKIPLGRLNAEQIECIADLAESIAGNNAHVTTRQDIQIHFVKLKDTPEMMRKLAKVGITTREACGNTVRNVTASPSGGVDPTEIFDPTPYAHAFTYHMMRNPACQNMPRKFKVAFDGGGDFTALPLIHDIGLVSAVRGNNGSGRKGFEVFVGGGLGSSPRVAKKMFDFLVVEDLLRLSEAVIRVFDRYAQRKVRMKARMKFFVEKVGLEKFMELVKKEFDQIQLPPESNDYLKYVGDWIESPPSVNDKDIPKMAESKGFAHWKKTNVYPQLQKGFSMVEVNLTTGDMAPKDMRGLANILRRYVGGKLRTMVHQNILIRWVRNQDIPSLYEELKKIGMVKPDAQTIYDVTSCPGTDSCRLGITASTGLARAIEKKLYEADGNVSKLAKKLRIKISGCPNSCGQHHIANMGFYGGGISKEGKTVPAFQLMMGGNYERETKIAKFVMQIPSKRVPEAVVRLVTYFSKEAPKGEAFNDFFSRIGKAPVVNLLKDLREIPSFEKDPDLYNDWERQSQFELQKGVIGECAGQLKEDIPPKVADGVPLLETAKAHLKHKDFQAAANVAYDSIVKTANGLLYYWLVATFNDLETTHEFENQFVMRGMFPEYKGFHQEIQSYREKKVDEALAKDWVDRAAKFLKACQAKEPEVAKASPRDATAPSLAVPDNLVL